MKLVPLPDAPPTRRRARRDLGAVAARDRGLPRRRERRPPSTPRATSRPAISASAMPKVACAIVGRAAQHDQARPGRVRLGRADRERSSRAARPSIASSCTRRATAHAPQASRAVVGWRRRRSRRGSSRRHARRRARPLRIADGRGPRRIRGAARRSCSRRSRSPSRTGCSRRAASSRAVRSSRALRRAARPSTRRRPICRDDGCVDCGADEAAAGAICSQRESRGSRAGRGRAVAIDEPLGAGIGVDSLARRRSSRRSPTTSVAKCRSAGGSRPALDELAARLVGARGAGPLHGGERARSRAPILASAGPRAQLGPSKARRFAACS